MKIRMREINATYRSERIDNIKGLLMFAVVFGHLIGGELAHNEDIFGLTHYMIYAVHMPLFVLLSGYLSKANTPVKKIIKNYFFPYVIFDLLYAVCKIITGSSLESLNLFIPVYVYWYILAVGIMKLILLLIKDRWWAAIVITGLSIFSPMVAEKTWGIMALGRTVLLFGIFYIGYLLRDDLDLINRNKIIITLCGIGCFLIEMILLKLNIVNIRWATHNYPATFSECILKWFYMFVIAYGIFRWLFIIIPDRKWNWGGVNRWGKNSLMVYLLHPFLVVVIKRFLTFVPLTGKFLFIVYLVVALIIVEILSMSFIKQFYENFVKSIAEKIHTIYLRRLR